MMPTMPAKDRALSKFGANVARLRAANGFSQEKLAFDFRLRAELNG